LPGLNHFTRRKGKAPITNKGWNPYRPFATVPLLEYGGLKPILPFLEGRSDATRRVVIRLHAASVDVRMGIVGAGGVCSDAACHVVIRLRNSRRCLRGVNDGRYGNPPQRSPRNADCKGGVFAAQRFPRPPQYTYTMPPVEPRFL